MKIKGKIVAAVVTVILAILFLSSAYTLKENKFGLIKEFGKVVETKAEAGLYFKKPFIQSVMKLPKEEQLYDLASSDVITSDKKSMIADCYVIWQIKDPLKYYQTLKSTSNAESRIDVLVYNSMKNVISSTKQDEVIQGKDGTLSIKIMDNLSGKNSADQYGISINSVEMKLLDLPSDNKDAVYSRMISERNKIAAQYTAEGESQAQQIRNDVDYQVRVILSNAEKDAKSIIAEGEAEYMKIIQAAYNSPERKDFYQFLRGLDATKASLTEGTMVIIDDEYKIIDNLKLSDKAQTAPVTPAEDAEE